MAAKTKERGSAAMPALDSKKTKPARPSYWPPKPKGREANYLAKLRLYRGGKMSAAEWEEFSSNHLKRSQEIERKKARAVLRRYKEHAAAEPSVEVLRAMNLITNCEWRIRLVPFAEWDGGETYETELGKWVGCRKHHYGVRPEEAFAMQIENGDVCIWWTYCAKCAADREDLRVDSWFALFGPRLGTLEKVHWADEAEPTTAGN